MPIKENSERNPINPYGQTKLDDEYLFEKYPDLDEGSLTKIRSSAVNQFYLVKLGKKIEIGKYLYLSNLLIFVFFWIR